MAQNLASAHWTKDALCKFDTKRFMSYDIAEVAKCKEICAKCPVQAECIMDNAKHDGSFIAAGMSKYDRLKVQWERVESVEQSNFRESDRYVSVVLRQVRKTLRP